MFDTMKVAGKIREARISQNMTQMNLADAMEVSYQAVSNWERGNSMPDISKLKQLSQILNISLDELLMTDSAKTLNRIINKEERENAMENTFNAEDAITLEEIQDIAPLLPPDDMEKLVDDSIEQQGKEELNLSSIVGLAPFLDKEYLGKLVQRAHIDSLRELAGLAPFLNKETLDSLVLSTDPQKDMHGIISLAPFLGKPTLDKLVQKMLPLNSLRELAGLGPFLSKETLDSLVLSADPQKDMHGIVSLAPFLQKETLDKISETATEKGILIAGLCPFLSQESLQKIAEIRLKSRA